MKKLIFVFVMILLILTTGCSYYCILDKFPLRQVQLSNQANGSFFLIFGSYRTEPMFSFYIVYPDGKLELKNADPNQVAIYEDTPTNPYVLSDTFGQGPHWTFHIPPKSIIEKISMDIPQ